MSAAADRAPVALLVALLPEKLAGALFFVKSALCASIDHASTLWLAKAAKCGNWDQTTQHTQLDATTTTADQYKRLQGTKTT